MNPAKKDIKALEAIIDMPLEEKDFEPMASSGLTHDHVVIKDSAYILRIPRTNQLGMKPLDYLYHQQACYDMAEASHTTPRCYGFIEPSEALPNGALVVQKIDGRKIEGSGDLQAVAQCLAQMAQITPRADKWVQKAEAPYATINYVINDVFGAYFESPSVNKEIREYLGHERNALARDISTHFNERAAPMAMIGGDSHLGNYLIDNKGKAWFVDLEFLAFDVPTLDTADAVLNITKSLVPENKFDIKAEHRNTFYSTYLQGIGIKDEIAQTVELSERLVTMRTLGWMCYWQDRGHKENSPSDKARENFNRLCAETLTPDGVDRVIKFPAQNRIKML